MSLKIYCDLTGSSVSFLGILHDEESDICGRSNYFVNYEAGDIFHYKEDVSDRSEQWLYGESALEEFEIVIGNEELNSFARSCDYFENIFLTFFRNCLANRASPSKTTSTVDHLIPSSWSSGRQLSSENGIHLLKRFFAFVYETVSRQIGVANPSIDVSHFFSNTHWILMVPATVTTDSELILRQIFSSFGVKTETHVLFVDSTFACLSLYNQFCSQFASSGFQLVVELGMNHTTVTAYEGTDVHDSFPCFRYVSSRQSPGLGVAVSAWVQALYDVFISFQDYAELCGHHIERWTEVHSMYYHFHLSHVMKLMLETLSVSRIENARSESTGPFVKISLQRMCSNPMQRALFAKFVRNKGVREQHLLLLHCRFAATAADLYVSAKGFLIPAILNPMYFTPLRSQLQECVESKPVSAHGGGHRITLIGSGELSNSLIMQYWLKTQCREFTWEFVDTSVSASQLLNYTKGSTNTTVRVSPYASALFGGIYISNQLLSAAHLSELPSRYISPQYLLNQRENEEYQTAEAKMHAIMSEDFIETQPPGELLYLEPPGINTTLYSETKAEEAVAYFSRKHSAVDLNAPDAGDHFKEKNSNQDIDQTGMSYTMIGLALPYSDPSHLSSKSGGDRIDPLEERFVHDGASCVTTAEQSILVTRSIDGWHIDTSAYRSCSSPSMLPSPSGSPSLPLSPPPPPPSPPPPAPSSPSLLLSQTVSLKKISPSTAVITQSSIPSSINTVSGYTRPSFFHPLPSSPSSHEQHSTAPFAFPQVFPVRRQASKIPFKARISVSRLQHSIATSELSISRNEPNVPLTSSFWDFSESNEHHPGKGRGNVPSLVDEEGEEEEIVEMFDAERDLDIMRRDV
jgi:hypothetical protein